jgi:hypothetical protein
MIRGVYTTVADMFRLMQYLATSSMRNVPSSMGIDSILSMSLYMGNVTEDTIILDICLLQTYIGVNALRHQCNREGRMRATHRCWR